MMRSGSPLPAAAILGDETNRDINHAEVSGTSAPGGLRPYRSRQGMPAMRPNLKFKLTQYRKIS